MTISTRYLGTLLALSFLSGCVSVKPIERPELPEQLLWRQQTSILEAPLPADWWLAFSAPTLAALIDQALTRSPDLLAAAERVTQAQLAVRVADSAWFPSVQANASSGRRRIDEDSAATTYADSTSVSLAASYEVDLWGRVSASVHSAKAGFQASRFDYHAARLSLAASLATLWFQWQALQERLQLAEENVAISERVMKIVEARYRNGVATAADVARQRTSLASQRAGLIPLQAQLDQTHNALARLSGVAPVDLQLAAQPLQELTVPSLAAGLPSMLLTRRPDLAAAEARLQAADGNVAAARAALLPSLTLSASAAVGSGERFSVASASNTIGWSVQLGQVLFDRGRLRAQTGMAEARRRELVESYRAAILAALTDTEDALVQVWSSGQQAVHQEQIVSAAQETLQLTEIRYREGSEDLLALLDAQRSLFQARDQAVQISLSRVLAAVGLYRALGGGWQLAVVE